MVGDWRVKVVVSVVLCLLAISIVAAPVSGYAYLDESDPENGEQLDAVPDEIILSYGGDGIQVADVEVIGPDGTAVSGDAAVDDADSQVVRVSLDGADEAVEGMYVVEWGVIGDDGHATSGSFLFTVGDGPVDREAVIATHEADADESIAWVGAVGKALLLMGVIGTIGIGAVATAVVYPVIDRHGQTRLSERFDRRLGQAIAGCSLTLLAGLLLFGGARVAQRGPLTVDTLREFLGTSAGDVWFAQVTVAVVIAVVSLLAVRNLVNHLIWLTAAVGGGPLIALGIAWNSHSATAVNFVQGVAIDFVHLLGASLWIGGLGALALFVSAVTAVVDTDEQVPLVAGAVRRFSLVAIVGVTLAVSTGLVLADWHVGSGAGLTETQYGLLLSVKLLAIGIALALGGYNHLILRRRLDPSATGLLDMVFRQTPVRTDGGERDSPTNPTRTVSLLEKSVRLELVVLVVVLVLSAVLTSAATAAVVVDEQGGDIEIQTISEELDDDVTVKLTALPAHNVIPDRFTFAETDIILFEAVFERDGERLHSDQPVELVATTADGDTQFTVELNEDTATYTTMQAFPDYGEWELHLTGSPTGSLETVWFQAFVMPDIDDRVLSHTDHGDGQDHEGHAAEDHSHDTDHDHDSPLDSPLQLTGLLVFLYGGLWVGYEANSLRQRQS